MISLLGLKGAAMSSNRRKIIFINKDFQFKIIGYFAGLAFIAIGAFYAANLWFFWKFSQIGVEMGLPSDHIFYQFINNQKIHMNWIYFVVSVLVFCLLFFGGALLSHKIAGPVYRLCEHLKLINQGHQVGKVKFREGDFFPEIQDHINPVIDKINGKNSSEKKVAS